VTLVLGQKNFENLSAFGEVAGDNKMASILHTMVNGAVFVRIRIQFTAVFARVQRMK